MDENNILKFDLLKVERGREKLCKCENRKFLVDQENRIVVCDVCATIFDPFDALVEIAKKYEELQDYQREAIKNINTFKMLADKENRRRIKNKTFKDMDSYYKDGMWPECPQCHEIFDPSKIDHWVHHNYIKTPWK